MNKKEFIRIMKKAGVGFVASCVAAGALSGCGTALKSGFIGLGADADKYTAGNAEITETVETLDIEWASGSVTIVEGDSAALRIEEDNASLPDEKKVQWWLNGTTLYVKFARKSIVGLAKKNLTVTLPKDMELKEFKLSSASGKVNIDELNAVNISVSSASGAMEIGSLNGKSIDLASASGKIEAAKIKGGELVVSTASGPIGVELAEVEKISADNASGKIIINASGCKEAALNSSSGGISAAFDSTPDYLKVSAASGNVKLALPEDGNFTANIDTASGKIHMDIPAVMSGGDYVVGDGSAKIEIDSASGDVDIIANK